MKKIVFIIIIIVSLVIINNLVRSIVNLWQKQELVGMTQEELEREKKLHGNLQEQYKTVKENDFVEKEARNKLFLVQPGEEVVVLPNSQIEEKQPSTQSQNRKKKLSPPEEWMVLFAFAEKN